MFDIILSQMCSITVFTCNNYTWNFQFQIQQQGSKKKVTCFCKESNQSQITISKSTTKQQKRLLVFVMYRSATKHRCATPQLLRVIKFIEFINSYQTTKLTKSVGRKLIHNYQTRAFSRWHKAPMISMMWLKGRGRCPRTVHPISPRYMIGVQPSLIQVHNRTTLLSKLPNGLQVSMSHTWMLFRSPM